MVMKRLRIGFMLGIAVLLLDATVPLLLAQRVVQLREAYNDSVTLEKQLVELLSAYKDLETGQRGFMITGRQEFLEPYDSGRLFIADTLPKIAVATADDPIQTEHMRTLSEMDIAEAQHQQERIEWRLSHANDTNPEAAIRGKALMDGLRKHITAMRQHEQQRMNTLITNMLRIETYSHRSIVIVTAIDLLLFIAVYWVAMRATRAQHRDSKALKAANASLYDEIEQRNAALDQLQRHTAHLNEIVETQTELVRSQLNIDIFLEQVVQRMLTVTAATGAVIEMIDGDEMVYEATSGSLEPFTSTRLLRSGSLSGLCIAQREVLSAVDTRTDPRVDHAACERVGASSMIVAPLLREGEPIGVLKIVSRERDAFDAGDLQTLQLMSGLLGAALGHQLQFEKNRDLLAERNITLRALKRELQRHEEYEIKLIRQRERTENILEASHEAFICIDRHNIVRQWNAQAALLFGWSKEEALGTPLDELIIPPRFHDAHLNGIAHFLKTGEGPVLNRHIELPALRRDGSEIPVELTITMQRDGDLIEFPCFLRDITERKSQERELQSRASIDHLTGLLNRAAFEEMLGVAVPRHQRNGTAMALLYLDVDRFKHINDTYGHAAGDVLLKAFSECLKTAVRASDFVGRLGGDEFCIVLDNIRAPINAINVAEKILELARAPLQFDGHTLTISTSIGIAFAQTPTLSGSEYIAQADAALYKAKQAGRNGYVLEIAGDGALAN